MFDSLGGGNTPLKEILLEIRGGNFFHCLGAPSNLIRPWHKVNVKFTLEQAATAQRGGVEV